MTATLDTSFFDLPLVLEAGPVSSLCYLAAYLWTLRHGTNGVIPAGAIGSLQDWAQLLGRGLHETAQSGSRQTPSQGAVGTEAADRCVQVGLMQRVTGGYLILDYHGGLR